MQKTSYTIGKGFIDKYSEEKTIICYNSLKHHNIAAVDSMKLHPEWIRQKKELFDEHDWRMKKAMTYRKLGNTRYKDIYIDSVAKEYIKDIKNKGFPDYIIFSEIKKPQVDGSKTLYVIWPKGTIAYIKKICSDYDYEPVDVDISQLLKFISLWQRFFLKYSDKEKYQETKKQYFNSTYCSRRHWKPIVDIQIHLDGTNIYCYSQYNWSNKYDKLTEIIQKILVQNDKSFIKKSKYSIPKSYMQEYVDDIDKIEVYKSQLVREWLNDSLPIHEDSLELKPRLVREAYYLYEYLMLRDTFITGHYFKQKSSNFWVTGIQTGTYKQKGIILTFEEEKDISKTYIEDFKPRPFKGYRMLYPNKKINEYLNTNYCKYGPLPVSMNFHQYMLGTSWPMPSFPEINSIYFSEDYTEAQVHYYTGYNYSVCMIRKEGVDWKLVEDRTIMFID